MRVLAFDVFGTLFDVDAVQDVARGIVKEPESFVALWRRKQLEYTFLLSLMGRFLEFSQVTNRALRYAATQSGEDLRPAQETTLLEAWTRLPLYPEVRPALEVLQKEHALVVLSNGEKRLLLDLLRHGGVDQLFSHVLSAGEVQLYKPSPAVYRLVGEKLGLPPEEVGLVSSNAFDVLGARAAGLKSLWVNRAGAVLDPLDLEPDIEVRNFQELLKLL